MELRIRMRENGGTGHIFSQVDLNWRRDGEVWAVRYRNRVLLQVVQDAIHAGMGHIRHPDCRLSDITNLSRARDAAISLAVGILNADRRRAVPSPVREMASPGLQAQPTPENTQEAVS